MLGFGAIGQFAIGEVGVATAETITVDKWFVALSEPPRFPMGARVQAQQFGALPDTFPFVSFGWYEELSKPPSLALPGARPAAQQVLSFQPAPSPFVATGWYVPLSEPPRFPRGLSARLQQFWTDDTQPIPLGQFDSWFSPLAEPVRFPQGLRPPQQQAYAAPPRLLPNPTTSGILSAIETKDVMLGGLRAWFRVISGEIGAIEANMPTAEIGISPQAAQTGEVAVIEQAASPALGSAVTPIFGSISVRIV